MPAKSKPAEDPATAETPDAPQVEENAPPAAQDQPEQVAAQPELPEGFEPLELARYHFSDGTAIRSVEVMVATDPHGPEGTFLAFRPGSPDILVTGVRFADAPTSGFLTKI